MCFSGICKDLTKFNSILGPIRTIICGGIGGMTLWIMIFPADVVKSRIQINKLNQSMLFCMRDIARTEGE